MSSFSCGVITFANFHGRPGVGSSKLRGDWLVDNWPHAEHYVPGKQYDAEIYQKVYWKGHQRSSTAVAIADLCDPDWVEDQSIRSFLDSVDAITCPTDKMAETFKRWIPGKRVKVIPDRLDLRHFKMQKEHEGDAQRVVWFGYAHNMKVLKQAIPTVKKLGLKITVVSDDLKFYLGDLSEHNMFTFVKWNEKTAYYDILKGGDIALLPPHRMADGGIPYRAKFKSNNKVVTAWALGLPVATNAEQLEWFIPAERRRLEAAEKIAHVKAHYDIRQSVLDYLTLITDITNG